MDKNCGTCEYLDRNNGRSHENWSKGKWNDFYCKKKGGYYEPLDRPCKDYQERLKPSNSGCFITTVVVNVLGYEDDCWILNTLRNFRNNVLQKDARYLNLLLSYDVIGPKLAQALRNNENKDEICVLVSQYYLIPMCKFITNEDYTQATNLYVGMVKFLQNQLYVGDDRDVTGYQYDESVKDEEKGHGRALVKLVTE